MRTSYNCYGVDSLIVVIGAPPVLPVRWGTVSQAKYAA